MPDTLYSWPDALTRGVFLTIEGIEGVGKSTAVHYIRDYLLALKKDFILTREPGGTKLAEAIRELLLRPDPHEIMTREAELLLMFASRAQHIANVILPALQAGKWVVSDRFLDASYAYQGGGRKIDTARIDMLTQWIVGNVKPTLTILLDADPAVGLARAKNRGPQDRIEQEKIDFFERVRNGYLVCAKQDPTRFHIINANQPLEKVQDELKKILDLLITRPDSDS